MDVEDSIRSLKEIDGAGNESYVVRGAKTRCSQGSEPSRLNLPQCHGVYLREKPQLNIMDFQPMINIRPFGYCRAQNGPCTPVVLGPWQLGKDNVLIDEQNALLNKSINFCARGGEITITDDGQRL